MNGFAATLALCLLGAATQPVALARAGGDCLTSPARLAETPHLTLPENAKPTAKTIAFQIDLGSDGRVRGMQLDQSSGDAAVDLDARQMLQRARYDPPQTGCVAYSGGLRLSFALSAEQTEVPPEPVKRDSTCTPYVTAFITPISRDRKRTGTAVVAVDVDASGTRSAPPVLQKSTGSPVLDAEAVRIAATGHYSFLRGGSCSPQAFTYPLELTFE